MTGDLSRIDRLHRLVAAPPVHLDDLIRNVGKRAGEDALDRLALASILAAELAELGDSLLGHFVDAARADGHPWSGIGAALGVTRQAAQQRFVTPDLGRFTDGARRAVAEAEAAAERLGHQTVGGVHVLLGLARVDGVAARVLASSGVAADVVESRVARLAPRRPGRAAGALPLTARAARLLAQLAPAEATTLGHNYVGTEHFLLAVLRRPDDAEAALLASFSLDGDEVRARVIDAMEESGTARP